MAFIQHNSKIIIDKKDIIRKHKDQGICGEGGRSSKIG